MRLDRGKARGERQWPPQARALDLEPGFGRHSARVLKHRFDVAVAALPEYAHFGHFVSPDDRISDRNTARGVLATVAVGARARRNSHAKSAALAALAAEMCDRQQQRHRL
ncbi:MAG: hypothetical protein ACTS6J_18455, partial [Burkholderiales bacterium]